MGLERSRCPRILIYRVLEGMKYSSSQREMCSENYGSSSVVVLEGLTSHTFNTDKTGPHWTPKRQSNSHKSATEKIEVCKKWRNILFLERIRARLDVKKEDTDEKEAI